MQTLDIMTLIAVLALGNALALLLLLFDTLKAPSPFDRLFVAARVLQCAAWSMIGLRGSIPVILSFSIGNSLMFCGIALEGLCLLSLKRPIGRAWLVAFAALLAAILAVWWMPGIGMNARLIAVAFLDPILFVIPGLFLLLPVKGSSPLQRFVGAVLLLCSLSSMARGAYIGVAGAYDFSVPGFFKVQVFLTRVLEMVFGTMGYILIRKEFADEKLKRSVEEKQLLLVELRHRVKNSLVVISSLTSLEADMHADSGLRASLEKVRDRIDAVAKLYDLLQAEDPKKGVRLDAYLRDLAERLFKGYSPTPDRIRLELELEALEVDAKTSISLGLIANELVTNSMKYAYPGDMKGILRLRLARLDGKRELEVADDGVGGGEAPRGLGTLIVAMLVDQIGGTLSRGEGRGTRVRIAF